MRRIPSLDGFRSISIVLVLIAHSRLSPGFPEEWEDIARHGAVGVTVFFVISGFLITTLLLHEKEKTEQINIKSFYTRRALRILPVYFLYLVTVIIWQQFESLNVKNENLIHAFTFTVNFEEHPSWIIGHFWSLSVEEQFYLFWPLLFGFDKKVLKWLIILLICYSVPARVIDYKFSELKLIFLTPYFSYSDSIMIGALGAIVLFQSPSMLKKSFFNNYYLQSFALILIVLFTYLSGYGKLAWVSLPFGRTIISFSILYLLLSNIEKDKSFAFRILNSQIMIHLGVLSYSIYIWQQFFFVGETDSLWRTFPYNWGFIYLTSLISYYCWEKVFLRLKNKRLFNK